MNGLMFASPPLLNLASSVVNVINVGNGSINGSGSTITISIAANGHASGILVGGIVIGGSTGIPTVACAWGADNLTSVDAYTGLTYWRLELFRLLVPANETRNLVFTMSGGGGAYYGGAFGIFAINAHQTTPFGSAVKEIDNSVDVSGALGDLALDLMIGVSGTISTPGAGQTELFDVANGGGGETGTYKMVEDAITTMSETMSGAGSILHMGIALKKV